jgi:hypothetical protein
MTAKIQKKTDAPKAEIPQKNAEAESPKNSAKTPQKRLHLPRRLRTRCWPDAPSFKDSTSSNGAYYGKIFLDIYISQF